MNSPKVQAVEEMEELARRARQQEAERRLGEAACSPCVVCGGPYTLRVTRAVPVVMIHCNTCGSEVPYNVTQKLNLYRARGKAAWSMENSVLSVKKDVILE